MHILCFAVLHVCIWIQCDLSSLTHVPLHMCMHLCFVFGYATKDPNTTCISYPMVTHVNCFFFCGGKGQYDSVCMYWVSGNITIFCSPFSECSWQLPLAHWFTCFLVSSIFCLIFPAASPSTWWTCSPSQWWWCWWRWTWVAYGWGWANLGAWRPGGF